LHDLENGKTVLLYETNGSAVAKDWTADGQLISSFIDTKDGEGIWNIDPTNEKPPAFITTGHEASWSPDGAKLAVLDHSPWIPSGENTGKLRIIDMQSKKEDVVFEIKGKDFLATGLSWSTSGEYIAFSLSTDYQSSQIYILDINTGVASKLTNDGNDHWSPSWSPDSQLISYVNRSPKTFENSIVISTIDGKCKVPVPRIADVWSVAWSPNGKQLLFSWRNSNIYSIDLQAVFGVDIAAKGIHCP
jgi:Tol biopolymer transport system component